MNNNDQVRRNQNDVKNDVRVTGEKIVNKVVDTVKKGSYAAGDGIETVGKKLQEKGFNKVGSKVQELGDKIEHLGD